MRDWDTRINTLKSDIQAAREKYVIPFMKAQPKPTPPQKEVSQTPSAYPEQNKVETELLPVDAETKRYSAVMKGMGNDPTTAEFNQRAKIAELALKQREIETKEDIVEMQMVGQSQGS